MKRTEEQVRTAESEKLGLEDALRHLDEQIGQAERAIAFHDDSVARERVAGEIEARVERIGAAVARLDAAAERFARARDELDLICLSDAPPDGFGQSPGKGIIAAAARLAKAIPTSDIDVIMRSPTCAGGAAIPMLNEMRSKAAAIRDGSAPALLPAQTERLIPVSISDMSVTLSRPIRWFAINGHEQHATGGGVTIPEPVARKALELGIAFQDDTTDGIAIRAAAKRYPMGVILKRSDRGAWVPDPGEPGEDGRLVAHEMWLTLPVSLFLHAEAERAARRAAE